MSEKRKIGNYSEIFKILAYNSMALNSMKNNLVTFIVFSLLALTGCKEDEAPDLKEQLTTSSWTINQYTLYPYFGYLDATDDKRQTYSFFEDSRYLLKIPYTYSDTICIQGEWSLNLAKEVVNFMSKDTVYYTSAYNRELSDSLLATYKTPKDWKIITINATQLEIEFIRSDTLLGNYLKLKK